MKYGYAVKRNGVLYMAGEEVPVGNSSTPPMNPLKEDKPSTNEGKQEGYKKSDIQRMNVENLKALAKELGIEITDESTGAKLKEEIIAKLDL